MSSLDKIAKELRQEWEEVKRQLREEQEKPENFLKPVNHQLIERLVKTETELKKLEEIVRSGAGKK